MIMSEQLFKIVGGQPVPMTAAEIAKLEADQAEAQAAVATGPDPDPVYRDLSDVEFMSLVRQAGPLTPTQFVEIMQTSTIDEIVMLRIMIGMNKGGIGRSAAMVAEGLGILKATTYLTAEGIDRIMAAWPTE
jgi:hypothetical protein